MHLCINIDGSISKTVLIDQEFIIVGRSHRATIQVLHEAVSRFHLQIRRAENGSLYVKDLNSSNGTYINNEPLPPEEEVEWQTFFPLSLSQKISISFIPSFENMPNLSLEKPVLVRDPEFMMNITRSRTRTKASTKINNKIQKESPTSSKRLLFYLIALFLIGFIFYFQDFTQDIYQVPLADKAIEEKKSNLELLNRIRPIASENKCTNDIEIKYCNFLKAQIEKQEGVIIKNETIYIFMNFDQRLENVQFDPSFSFADKRNQLTYLMAFHAMGEVNRNFASKMKLREVIITDSSSSPGKINHILKIDSNNLNKISLADIDTIKQTLSMKKDNQMFNNFILPIIEIYSDY